MFESFIPTLVITAISIGLIAAGFLFFRRQVSHSLGAEKDELKTAIDKINLQLDELRSYSDYYTSKQQLDNAQSRQSSIRSEIEKAKGILKDTESKLDKAQKDVDDKEAKQNEVKSAKEGEQTRLEELKAGFETASGESIELERKLAQSLKELDEIIGNLDLTQAQKEILNSLSQALTSAGGRLRDIISEHQTVAERLESLKEQHGDLEDEYTKLVEQQLGG